MKGFPPFYPFQSELSHHPAQSLTTTDNKLFLKPQRQAWNKHCRCLPLTNCSNKKGRNINSSNFSKGLQKNMWKNGYEWKCPARHVSVITEEGDALLLTLIGSRCEELTPQAAHKEQWEASQSDSTACTGGKCLREVHLWHPHYRLKSKRHWLAVAGIAVVCNYYWQMYI